MKKQQQINLSKQDKLSKLSRYDDPCVNNFLVHSTPIVLGGSGRAVRGGRRGRANQLISGNTNELNQKYFT